MRPIKFRAWDRENKKMCDLESIHFGHAGAPTLTAWITTPQGYQRLLVFGENADLIQFTGLKDLTGREIYEGHVVRIRWNDGMEDLETVAEVNFGLDGCFFWDDHKRSDSLFYPHMEFEVIGNIYENPELLGQTAGEDGGK